MSEKRNTILLSSKQFIHIQDGSDGHIYVYTGPGKCTPQDNDNLILYDHEAKQFENVSAEEAVQDIIYAKQGQYVILSNDTPDSDHPKKGQLDSVPLNEGIKCVISGPVQFSLWPGQYAKVIDGHSLFTNQYLLIRITDGKTAQENWKNAIIEKVKKNNKEDSWINEEEPQFMTGQYYIIKGTEVSFFMPCSGMKIIHHPEDKNKYEREAITLRQLEYCILLDQDGTKEYIYGPTVVFPNPTQTMFKDKIFNAVELDEHWGIHIKVNEDYEEDDKKYKEGDEIFITGKDTKIYWPRKEHNIIVYGEDEVIYYGITIPAGEARYVLNRISGKITLEKGPQIFLPNPITQVIVQRGLSSKMCNLMYPGNKEASQHNNKLSEDENLKPNSVSGLHSNSRLDFSAETITGRAYSNASKSFEDIDASFRRKKNYTPPRTISLHTSKYAGAIKINVWSNFAVKVVNSFDENKNKVIVGETTLFLDYEENLDTLEFSTGIPKSDDIIKEDVYLQITSNIIRDSITVTTKDLIEIKIPIKYKIDFLEEYKEKWFFLKNYVEMLTTYMRSLIENHIKSYMAEDFLEAYQQIIFHKFIRKNKKYTGILFEENGMLVSDLIVDQPIIIDNEISRKYIEKHTQIFENSLSISVRQDEYRTTKELENISQKLLLIKSATSEKVKQENIKDIKRKKEINNEEYLRTLKEKEYEGHIALLTETDEKNQNKIRLEKEKAEIEQNLWKTKENNTEKINVLNANVAAIVKKVNAISPNLANALTTIGEYNLLDTISENIGNLSILEGNSLVITLRGLLKDSGLENIIKRIQDKKE